jgi:hypothetical protein
MQARKRENVIASISEAIQKLVVSCQLSVVSCQLSVVSFFLDCFRLRLR